MKQDDDCPLCGEELRIKAKENADKYKREYKRQSAIKMRQAVRVALFNIHRHISGRW